MSFLLSSDLDFRHLLINTNHNNKYNGIIRLNVLLVVGQTVKHCSTAARRPIHIELYEAIWQLL